jgi:hypothetical protein
MHRHAYIKGLHLCGNRDAQKVNKTDVLVMDNLDLIDQAKAAKVVAELLLCCTLIWPAKINIAACIALANGEHNLAQH